MSQLDLFGNVPAGGLRLGPAQQAVMAALQEHGSLTMDEAGSVIHALRGKHPADATCAFCGPDGRAVLRSLKRRGLLSMDPDGVARTPRENAAGNGGGAGDSFGVFPDGYRAAM